MTLEERVVCPAARGVGEEEDVMVNVSMDGRAVFSRAACGICAVLSLWAVGCTTGNWGDPDGGGAGDGGSGGQPGWHFTNWEYIIAPIDVTLQENGYHSAVAGLYDYSEGTGDKNDFRVKKWRVDGNGNPIAGSNSVSTWEDPPTYLAPGALQRLQVSRHYEDAGSTWGQVGLGAHFDAADLASADYATAAKIAYVDDAGSSALHEFDGVIETEDVLPEATPETTRAVWIRLEAYSFKYVYEWRD